MQQNLLEEVAQSRLNIKQPNFINPYQKFIADIENLTPKEAALKCQEVKDEIQKFRAQLSKLEMEERIRPNDQAYHAE